MKVLAKIMGMGSLTLAALFAVYYLISICALCEASSCRFSISIMTA